ncbi:hypothetical protein A5893_03850 [Pedobacter psychrophilus]|uniref:Uncharacterized protein n=2 Tax=Pedobacter psychrophilus TaxID=1826909 RepID=A0A179DMI9_9SPHI|nr:hypothetical protein A5893_03850 [Pedobacter psychrophilus]
MFLTSGFAFSQTPSNNDSLKQAALADVNVFKLNKPDLITFRKAGRSNFRSDYFKPNTNTTRDTSLLKDSVYVQAFREAAFVKTRKRRTTGHYLAVGGAIYLGVSLVAALVIAVGLFQSYK